MFEFLQRCALAGESEQKLIDWYDASRRPINRGHAGAAGEDRNGHFIPRNRESRPTALLKRDLAREHRNSGAMVFDRRLKS